MQGDGKTMTRPVGNEWMPFDTADLVGILTGRDLPPDAEEQLRLAGLAYQQDNIAEQHLWRAHELAPDHMAVLIGFYRFYFYKARLADALNVARRCILKTARDNALDPDWRSVAPEDADFGSYDAVRPRLFLFVLKAYAYLQLRVGNIMEGRDAAEKLLHLDPTDKVGARILLDVLHRMDMSHGDANE